MMQFRQQKTDYFAQPAFEFDRFQYLLPALRIGQERTRNQVRHLAGVIQLIQMFEEMLQRIYRQGI